MDTAEAWNTPENYNLQIMLQNNPIMRIKDHLLKWAMLQGVHYLDTI